VGRSERGSPPRGPGPVRSRERSERIESEAALERYRGIVPAWESFLEHLRRPEPTTLRVRRGRIDPETLASRLAERGFEVKALPAPAPLLRVVEEPYSPARTLEHWAGLFYIQRASSAVAASALGAAPGDRVLDLCAAPGGKATHLAEIVGEAGGVVANDPVDGRLRALLGNLYRLGLPNVLVTSADGRQLPESATFDRVLVDAPCSAEGSLRGKEGVLPEVEPGFREQIAETQAGLLEKAVRMVRPGGTVLYVTCTFAPEENEAVVDRILREAPVRVESIPLELPHAPGLTEFGSGRFDPSLEAAWRIYPHHLDSGGLFLCRLRKEGDRPREGWAPVPGVFPGSEGSEGETRDRVEVGRTVLEDELGVPAKALDRFAWLRRGKSVWLHTLSGWPLEAWGEPPERGWRVMTVGMRAFKRDPRTGERPTNDLLRLLGREIRRNRLALPRSAWPELLETRRLSREAVARAAGGGAGEEELPRGLLALVLDGSVVGRGWGGRRGVQLEIPKARARSLRGALEAP